MEKNKIQEEKVKTSTCNPEKKVLFVSIFLERLMANTAIFFFLLSPTDLTNNSY